jgi:hypothetical protein
MKVVNGQESRAFEDFFCLEAKKIILFAPSKQKHLYLQRFSCRYLQSNGSFLIKK